MLVTFTTDAYSDILMTGDVAFVLLGMMGHSATVPGAILAPDIPVALNRLKVAIDAERKISSVPEKSAENTTVSMVHRSLPLIELLAAAAKAESNVMWK